MDSLLIKNVTIKHKKCYIKHIKKGKKTKRKQKENGKL